MQRDQKAHIHYTQFILVYIRHFREHVLRCVLFPYLAFCLYVTLLFQKSSVLSGQFVSVCLCCARMFAVTCACGCSLYHTYFFTWWLATVLSRLFAVPTQPRYASRCRPLKGECRAAVALLLVLFNYIVIFYNITPSFRIG